MLGERFQRDIPVLIGVPFQRYLFLPDYVKYDKCGMSCVYRPAKSESSQRQRMRVWGLTEKRWAWHEGHSVTKVLGRKRIVN